MFHKNIRIILLISSILIVVVIAVSCFGNNPLNRKTDKISNKGINIRPSPIEKRGNNPGNDSNRKPYELNTAYYTEPGIKITYPQLTHLIDLERQKKINQLIRNEALKVRNYYPEDNQELNLEINHEIKRQDENFLSIQYSGIGYMKGGAYPNNLFYTTNIDLRQGSRLRLKDLIVINQEIVKKFKSGGLQALRPEHKDILKEYTITEMMEKLNKTDSPDHPGKPDTFSYFTKNSLGLSFGVAHAIGDHAEFEIKLQEIKNNLKTDVHSYIIPNRLLPS